MRILLVEDELNTANLLAKGLREDTYAVDVASDGEQALAQAYMTDYDLIILDVMLPLKDGFAVCHELRSTGSAMPILMLTARDAVADRIKGLDTGPMTIWSNPSILMNCWPGCARCYAGKRRSPRRSSPSRISPFTLDHAM